MRNSFLDLQIPFFFALRAPFRLIYAKSCVNSPPLAADFFKTKNAAEGGEKNDSSFQSKKKTLIGM